MKPNRLLETRIGKEFKIGRNQKWTLEATAFVGCILGNDYIKKVPGAGKKTVQKFMSEVVNIDGSMKEESEIYDHFLDQIMSKPSHCSTAEKEKWATNTEFRFQYIKQLMESIGMFINGPVFYIISTDENETPREALWSENYCVNLRDFRGRDIAWTIDSPNETDQMYGRDMVIGFDPAEQLQDVLDKHRTPEQSIEDVYLECFKLIRFIRWRYCAPS